MKVGDLVYAKYPKMAGNSCLPGIIIKKGRLNRYLIAFPNKKPKWMNPSSLLSFN